MAVEEASAPMGETDRGWPFSTSRFRVPPGSVSELDQHEVAEIWMVRSGAGNVRSGDDIITIAAGESVFFPSMVPHQVETTSSSPLEVFSIWWRDASR
jgi:mannose-6-phosphate isomerase-like protein (cupin superfamily)